MTPRSVSEAASESVTPRARASRLREALLWIALLAACSSVLSDLLRHIVTNGWPAYAVVFWCLLVREIVRTPGARAPRPLGFLLLAAGLVVQLLMVKVGFPRMGRPGVGVAILGLALALGHPRPAFAVLEFWGIPVPSMVLALASPWLESALARGAAALLNPFGAGLELVKVPLQGWHLAAGESVLRIDPANAGLPLVVLLTGLAWYTGSRQDLRARAILRRCVLASTAFLPLAFAGMLAAGAFLAAGRTSLAWTVLNYGPWVLGAAGFLVWSLRHRDRSTATHPTA